MNTKPVPLLWRSTVLPLLFVTTCAQALEFQMPAQADLAAELVEQVLAARGIEEYEQASTGGFHLFSAAHTSGSHITVTLREVAEQDSSYVTIVCDSPPDTDLETNLAQEILAGLKAAE